MLSDLYLIDDGGEMMLPTKLTEQWNEDKTTESSKTQLNAEEKSETTEWSQEEATESSKTELNAEEKSEITESQSVNPENQEDIKPGTLISYLVENHLLINYFEKQYWNGTKNGIKTYYVSLTILLAQFRRNPFKPKPKEQARVRLHAPKS